MVWPAVQEKSKGCGGTGKPAATDRSGYRKTDRRQIAAVDMVELRQQIVQDTEKLIAGR
jgi:hypothetical protein